MNKIIEIRWHGRGGQGAKTACLLLADVAFSAGKYVQGFPEYGPERMGAPITAYNRISAERCTVHSNIYTPDYVVVVDESLLESVDVTAGLKPEGAIVINSAREPEEFRSGHIQGAVNIPLSKIRGIGIPKDTPLFVYCLRGTRSLRAARILTRMGYGKARSIGGIAAYRGKKEQ